MFPCLCAVTNTSYRKFEFWKVWALLTKILLPLYQIAWNEAVCAVGGFKLHRMLPCWVSAEVIFWMWRCPWKQAQISLFFQCVGSNKKESTLWNKLRLTDKFPFPSYSCFLGCDTILVLYFKSGEEGRRREELPMVDLGGGAHWTAFISSLKWGWLSEISQISPHILVK